MADHALLRAGMRAVFRSQRHTWPCHQMLKTREERRNQVRFHGFSFCNFSAFLSSVSGRLSRLLCLMVGKPPVGHMVNRGGMTTNTVAG